MPFFFLPPPVDAAAAAAAAASFLSFTSSCALIFAFSSALSSLTFVVARASTRAAPVAEPCGPRMPARFSFFVLR